MVGCQERKQLFQEKGGVCLLNCEDLIQDGEIGGGFWLGDVAALCLSTAEGSWSPLAQPQMSGCVAVTDSVSKRRMGCWFG